MVECKLPKLDVAGSSPVARSRVWLFTTRVFHNPGFFIIDVWKFAIRVEIKMARNRKLVSSLWTMIEPVLEADGIELVEMEYLLSGGFWTLRLYIDRPEGVTLEDCATISRQVSALLDAEDPIEHHYNLEVSSPGINRVIRKLTDFQRFSDRQARIRTAHKVEGRRNFAGILKGTRDGVVIIEVEKTLYEIDAENIEKAHLETPPDEILQQSLRKRALSMGG